MTWKGYSSSIKITIYITIYKVHENVYYASEHLLVIARNTGLPLGITVPASGLTLSISFKVKLEADPM